jgi:hypothetical protein
LQKEGIVGLIKNESFTIELDKEKTITSTIPQVPGSNNNAKKDPTEEYIKEFENKVIDLLNSNDDSQIFRSNWL